MKLLYVTRHFNHSGYVILERLLREGFRIEAVLLHRDRNPWRRPWMRPFLLAGYRTKCAWYRCRPLKTVASEELLAKEHGIPTLLVDSIKDDFCFAAIKSLAPDLIVLGGGWHELLPERIYALPPLGCINTHPSLLPEFRGTSITRWQVLHGVDRSGSVIHCVDAHFDAGSVLAVKEIPVHEQMTPQELFLALAYAGADLMPILLRAFKRTGPQSSFLRTGDSRYCRYFGRWSWNYEDLRIDWSRTLRDIHFHVLANTQESYEHAGPWFVLRGKRYILRITRLHVPTHIGTVASSAKSDVLRVTGSSNGSLFLQRQGDPHVLELVQMQRDDGFRKLRRAHPVASILRLSANEVFAPE